MALEMKPRCMTCNRKLEVAGNAYICSFECTYCPACAEHTHRLKCPNCGGDLVPRPKRARD